MPLTGDPDKDIPELISSGRPKEQAVAIALKKERGDDDDCDDDRKDDDRSSEGHEKEAERLKVLAKKETDPKKRAQLEEEADFHGKEVGIADKKDQGPPSLLNVVERIRNDMAANREAIDNLTGKIYTTSSRIRRLEEGT